MGELRKLRLGNAENVVTPYTAEDDSIIINETTRQIKVNPEAIATQDDLDDLKDNKADVIISTTSGSIAHFEDGAEANAVSVIAHIEPVQDLHGYDIPWPAGGGVNKFDLASSFTEGETITNNGITATFSNGYLKITGTNTSGSAFNVIYKNISGSLSAGTYIMPNHINVRATIDGGSNTNYTTAMTASTGISLVAFYVVIPASATNLNWNIPLLLAEGTTSPTTYSPYSNICPITGHTEVNVVKTGKNLLKDTAGTTTSRGITYTLNSDGSIHIEGTASGNSFKNIDTMVLPKGDYVFSVGDSTITGFVLHNGIYYNLSNGIIEFTSDGENTCLARVTVMNGRTIDTIIYPMIRFASDTDDTYEPYQGETIPITFPTEAGTVYGGYVDAVKGELVVDRAKSTVLSSMTFGTVGSSGHGWYIARSSIAPLNTGENYDTGIVCDKLQTAIGASTLAQDLVFVNTSGQIRINTAQVFNTKEDMLSYFGDSIDIVYPIEPITYQLTPQQITTLLGVNNVWNDCNGNTDVEYKADTKLYIEQLTKPTEDDMTANANIVSGKFFMVGNRLFLSTSAIASGDTINPGTNCTELSLADALNNLN